MKIIKRRIHNVENYIAIVDSNQSFYIAFTDLENKRSRIKQIGFEDSLNIGESILPTPLGSVSRFNADGRYIPRRDLPKETYYMYRTWSWTDWAGKDYSKIVSIPRERYQRDFILPPSEELLIDNYNSSKIIVSRILIKNDKSIDEIKHIINLFLELFGECDIIQDSYQPFLHQNIKRLNWKVFPPGKYPWDKVKDIVRDRIERQPKGNRPIIADRFKTITHLTTEPLNFVAVGEGGFSDYVVFGFPQKNIYILESTKTGNATYVFDSDWEELSKLTKADILGNSLQQERIIHTPSWESEVKRILK